MRERPQWREHLLANTRRLVTVHELYRGMQALAAYPNAATAADDGAGGTPTIFDEISEQRTCKDAGVPEIYCACRSEWTQQP